uniref:NADH-ubiquinone oxidoreductase chain 6 n=1 Tax=Lepyrus sp. G312 TaxID=2480751 RepID=A0A3G2JZD1_9CUCU|nr:NADH dehydrogenase subunit 6 [Lepyrus sp. G312]
MFTSMLIMNWMFSVIFMFLNHPLSLGCILLIQTILTCLCSGFLYFNFWFSYILFLVMIGGMLVMFMYMTSIASNEKFKLPKKMMFFSCMMMMISLIILILFKDNMYSNMMMLNTISMNQSINMYNYSLTKFFNYPNMMMMITLMMYLLSTLIAIVKIMGKSKTLGPLRQK